MVTTNIIDDGKRVDADGPVRAEIADVDPARQQDGVRDGSGVRAEDLVEKLNSGGSESRDKNRRGHRHCALVAKHALAKPGHRRSDAGRKHDEKCGDIRKRPRPCSSRP